MTLTVAPRLFPDRESAAALSPDVLTSIVNGIPESWLAEDRSGLEPARLRAAYASYLVERLAPPRLFVEETVRVR